MKAGHPEKGKSPYARRQKTPYRYSDLYRNWHDAVVRTGSNLGREVEELAEKHRAMIERMGR